MSEGGVDNSKPNENIYTRVRDAAFDMELATRRGDQEVIKTAHQKYSDQMRIAIDLRVDSKKLNIAATNGRIDAAKEEGDLELVKFLEQSIKDL